MGGKVTNNKEKESRKLIERNGEKKKKNEAEKEMEQE